MEAPTYTDLLGAAREEWTGRPVMYVDEVRHVHFALITQVWNVGPDNKPNYINLVFGVDDEAKSDQYGRQIERATSVPIKDDSNAAGRHFYECHLG